MTGCTTMSYDRPGHGSRSQTSELLLLVHVTSCQLSRSRDSFQRDDQPIDRTAGWTFKPNDD
jgi:hypothetical protein